MHFGMFMFQTAFLKLTIDIVSYWYNHMLRNSISNDEVKLQGGVKPPEGASRESSIMSLFLVFEYCDCLEN